MKIAVITEAGEIHNIEVDSQIELENLKALIEAETGIPPADQIISYHGQELADPKKTLEQYNVLENDMLLIRKNPSQTIPREHRINATADLERSSNFTTITSDAFVHTQPELFNAAFTGPTQFATLVRQMNQRSQQMQQNIHNDPLNIDDQRKIEEGIRMENVERNKQKALDLIPQFFAPVVMLYIDIEVNGHPIKAFVDSGAQSTIMSPQCAEKCGIMRLVDQRCAGQAIGVGTAEITGRIHYIDIDVKNLPLSLECSFMIMQACIDLKKKALIINDVEIPFLAEHELPERAMHIG
ncbi:17643_t:CDS:2 [Dentiscutata erythropus]|uniref:17643_t:CDS:1 n=1 Tax=Dentiscutata erythropus TaxID=1348616 RepID=A0A9N9AHT3_9GLOM|nr:17643_t:CDS:2 [Dentiscutata erythropus]